MDDDDYDDDDDERVSDRYVGAAPLFTVKPQSHLPYQGGPDYSVTAVYMEFDFARSCGAAPLRLSFVYRYASTSHLPFRPD